MQTLAPPLQRPSVTDNPMPAVSGELGRQGQRLQELIEKTEAVLNPAARDLFQECLQSLMAFHGQGLARMLELAREGGTEDGMIFDRLIRDDGVRGLLLIHGLHPIDLETRLHETLDKVRPYMQSHGGNVELVSLVDDVATLRLQGACKTCRSSAVTLELAVRRAVEEHCPDLMGLEVEGVSGGQP